MNNEKLGKLLQAAEKYGAEAAYEMAVELQAPGVDPQTLTNETAEIAAFINKGTAVSSKAKMASAIPTAR